MKRTFFLAFLMFFSSAALYAQNRALEEAKTDHPADFYVSLEGNDAWSGKLAEPNEARTDGPFATLERAKMALRESRAKETERAWTVVVREGDYELSETFPLTKEDCGTEKGRITWRTNRGEKVRLLGGRQLKTWRTVTEPAVLEQLSENVRGKVIQIDLRALGISDFGSPKEGMELYFEGKPMTLSRYPNDGFVKITGLTPGYPKDIRGTKGSTHGDFQFEDERLTTWGNEKEIWVHGYWFWDWAEEKQKVESIDAATRTLKVVPPYHTYGYRIGQWFYAFNLLCELDQPGEYYIDRDRGILYFYPPGEVTEGSMVVTTLPTLVSMKDVSQVTFRGFTLEYARGTALAVAGGRENLVAACTIANISGSGISVSGTQHTIFGCHLYHLGKSGIAVYGGDRKTLVPGKILVMNNEIHDYALRQRVYAPGIMLQGVGNRAAHNKIYNAPHMGMGFGGNEHVIEFNEIYNVCFESNDAGAIYTGRNWSMRGNVLRHNYLHDIRGFENRGCVGIYLDDQFSSAEIYGNIFRNVTRATMIGGGRDCRIVNNLYIDCAPCVHLDARGLGWQKDFTQNWINELREKGTHLGMNLMEPPYSEKYPELTRILDENPGTPCGNVVTHNICVRGNWNGTQSGQWRGSSIWAKAAEFNTMEPNFLQDDPMLEEEAAGNYTLKPESPALKGGFQQIPWQKIGLFDSPLRAAAQKHL
ncbi:MAG: right-handed parallel beta-helix repeat-containing protein [Planctomycetia bacterium]|nr:right-handed parallel beta-helix repeat-containing protein [Planctomycetia bacterium]